MGPGAAPSDPSAPDRETSGNRAGGEEPLYSLYLVSSVLGPPQKANAMSRVKQNSAACLIWHKGCRLCGPQRPPALPALELRAISNHTGVFVLLAKTKHWHSQEGQVGPGPSAGSGERGHSDPREGPSSGQSDGLSEKAYSTGLADCGHLATLSSRLTHCKGDGAAAWGGGLY